MCKKFFQQNITKMANPKEEIISRENIFLEEVRELIAKKKEYYLKSKNLFSKTTNNQTRYEEEVFNSHNEKVYNRLSRDGGNLYFGMILDSKLGEIKIGKIGVHSENGDNLLVDWRAPIASKFYQSTNIDNCGLDLKRNLVYRNDAINDIIDTKYTENYIDEYYPGSDNTLLDELNSSKTGNMKEVISTIQSEQDKIIRHNNTSSLVVQGYAGTGKTVVALHRCAYILYQNRERLEELSALIIGPNNLFLEYISQVLPSLGEENAKLSTVESLYYIHKVYYKDSDDLSILKGSKKIKDIIDLNIKKYYPNSSFNFTYSGEKYCIELKKIKSILKQTYDSTKSLNQHRDDFILELLDVIVETIIKSSYDINRDEYEDHKSYLEDYNAIRYELEAELRDDDIFKKSLNLFWMPTTPEKVYQNLFVSLDEVKMLSEYEKSLLEINANNPINGRYSKADLIILDYILGEIGPVKSKIHNYKIEGNIIKQSLIKFQDDYSFIYEQQFGHVVIDEAQELSYLEWLAVKRRAKNNSVTAVGDIYQRNNPAGIEKWEILEEIFPNIALKELKVNFRNTSQMMDHVIDTLKKHDVNLNKIMSYRSDENSIEFTNDIDLSSYPEYTVIGLNNESSVFNSPEIVKGREFDYVIVYKPLDILKEYGVSALYVSLTRATKKMIIVN